MSATKEPTGIESASIREVTRNVYAALLDDELPAAAGVEDFGLKSTEHYGALQYAIRHHGVTAEKLDEVLGNGPAITALIRDENPYRGVVFTTAWDHIMVRIEEWKSVSGGEFSLGRLFASTAALEALQAPEIAAALEEHAARAAGAGDVGTGDSGAADPKVIASTYRSAAGHEVCITTEADRSMTLVWLSGEF
jgi:hypothetical protein